MASDYSKIRRTIQEAKHLTDAERDELIKLIKGDTMTTTTNTTKKYELTILVDEIAPQEVIDGLTEKIKGYGTVVKFEDEGVKRLAYPIRNHKKARYLFYTLELENDVPAKLSSHLNIEDNVVRYLLVRLAQ